MEKLPDNLHKIMERFRRDDYVRDEAFIEGKTASVTEIRQLKETGLVYIPDKDWSECYLELTDAGKVYRRMFFPTKEEQIEDLRAALQDIFNESPYLSHAYCTAYRALTGKEFKP